MANPSKRRGTEWETAVTRYLRAQVPNSDDIRRVAQTGRLDVGDVHALPFVLECKNVAKIDLAAFVDQADREAYNACAPHGVAVVKRRNHGPASAYAVMSLETFAGIVAAIRELRANTSA